MKNKRTVAGGGFDLADYYQSLHVNFKSAVCQMLRMVVLSKIPDNTTYFGFFIQTLFFSGFAVIIQNKKKLG